MLGCCSLELHTGVVRGPVAAAVGTDAAVGIIAAAAAAAAAVASGGMAVAVGIAAPDITAAAAAAGDGAMRAAVAGCRSILPHRQHQWMVGWG